MFLRCRLLLRPASGEHQAQQQDHGVLRRTLQPAPRVGLALPKIRLAHRYGVRSRYPLLQVEQPPHRRNQILRTYLLIQPWQYYDHLSADNSFLDKLVPGDTLDAIKYEISLKKSSWSRAELLSRNSGYV